MFACLSPQSWRQQLPRVVSSLLLQIQVELLIFQTVHLFCLLLLSSVQLLSRVRLFATPWIAAHQASLSITNSRRSPRLTSIESVMPSSHLSLCSPLLLLPQSLPASEPFPMSQLFAWGGQSTGVSASASFLPKKSQGWSPSEWIGRISLQSKGLSRQRGNSQPPYMWN